MNLESARNSCAVRKKKDKKQQSSSMNESQSIAERVYRRFCARAAVEAAETYGIMDNNELNELLVHDCLAEFIDVGEWIFSVVSSHPMLGFGSTKDLITSQSFESFSNYLAYGPAFLDFKPFMYDVIAAKSPTGRLYVAGKNSEGNLCVSHNYKGLFSLHSRIHNPRENCQCGAIERNEECGGYPYKVYVISSGKHAHFGMIVSQSCFDKKSALKMLGNNSIVTLDRKKIEFYGLCIESIGEIYVVQDLVFIVEVNMSTLWMMRCCMSHFCF